MEILAEAMQSGTAPNMDAVVRAVPYCAWLNLSARIVDGHVVLEMPFDPKLVGNPILPALHGGVIGSLLECAALIETVWAIRLTQFPKPVDITVDYLRSGRAVTTYARARLARQGRRVVNVHAELW